LNEQKKYKLMTVKLTTGVTGPSLILVGSLGRRELMLIPVGSLDRRESLSESEALSSVGFFAEFLLSGTRQRRLCRVPHSVKLGSRQRASLPSVGHSAQDPTRQRQVCRVSNTRQRAVSGRPKAAGRQSLPRANGWHSAKSLLCRVPHSRH
jgi:hypothetical protein